MTQYLTEDGVRGTLALLATAAANSRMIFTYVRKDFLDGTFLYRADGTYQGFVAKTPMRRFGLAPNDIDRLLQEYGWAEREQVGSREYINHYIRPTGRDLPASEIERFVYAEKS
ncbi:hypothetical protein ACFZDK_33855 [Streptomyces sp. NPDC007901]|uniref:hypothetical protein n=1 Tax=Streptomyces sp. NPDC007901 TaxID=3364785 RepID=UPI0036E59E11